MPTTVSIRQASYDYHILRPLMFDLLTRYCGRTITPHTRVIIKPNLLSPAGPETAVVTHPLVVRAAAEFVLSRGARPFISDSPAMGSFERILNTGGFRQALSDLDVEFREFKTSVPVDIGEPFGTIDVAEDAMNADVLINLAKLKTHSQMLLTLGVKNTFGCVVGLKKSKWHMRAGINRDLFARLLVLIHRSVNPAVTIIDGITAMEGSGPGKGGTPRQMGVLMGSDKAIAVDSAVCRMLGITADTLGTNRAATSLGMHGDPIRVDGDLPMVDEFVLPHLSAAGFGPRSIQKFLRRHLLQRPAVDRLACTACGECVSFCPLGAVHFTERLLSFDYEQCIRCYCCVEVCPCGALFPDTPLSGKVARKLFPRY
jgi:uncharacterized protein (DUF362 family)/ferredoxin